MANSNNHNESRANSDIALVVDMLKSFQQECNEGHKETSAQLKEIKINQIELATKAKSIESTVSRIGEKLDHTAERVAKTEGKTEQLAIQNLDQFNQLRELHTEVKVTQSRDKTTNVAQDQRVAFYQTKNFAYMLLAIVVVVAIVYKVINHDNVQNFIPAVSSSASNESSSY